jgi:toxin FitB
LYLLDTNVVSEFRWRRPHPSVAAWVESLPNEHIHVSVVTLGELQAGVEVMRERDAEKAAEIEAWVDEVLDLYNVLAVDAHVCRFWAKMMHRRHPDLIPDALIAATAVVHDLAGATRNVRDFEGLGVPVLNPFESQTG